MTVFSLAILMLGLALPLFVQWRAGTPLALVLALSVFYAVKAAIVWAAVHFGAAAIVLSTASGDAAYQDTYYVVANTYYAAGLAAIWFCLLLGLWAEGRYGRLSSKRPLVVCIWSLHICMLVSFSLLGAFARSAMPRRYVDHTDVFERMSAVQGLASSGALISLVALFTFVFWSLALRLRST